MATFTAMFLKTPNFSGDVAVAQAAIDLGFRTTNVVVEADDLEQVFAKLNHGSGEELDGYRGRSLSVGDVVYCNDTGDMFMVAASGFTQLP